MSIANKLLPRPMSVIVLLCLLSSGRARSYAQITEMHEENGRWISCTRSGMRGWSTSCGTRPEIFSNVFVGTVLQADAAPNHETSLRIQPDEVFLGDKPAEFAITTNQGECIPAFHRDDRWLFFLYRDHESGRLLVSYASGSAPVADAGKTVALLRQLQKMSTTGIIQGNVQSITTDKKSETYHPVPNQKLIAKEKGSEEKHIAITDKDGNYQFQPLPLGTYELTSNTTKGLWAEEGPVKIEPHSCTAVDFELRPDGGISGQVLNYDGTPARYPQVWAVSQRTQHMYSASTTENGNFEIRGLEPGRYLIGIDVNLEGKLSLYYPGVKNIDSAVPIDLDPTARLKGINFILPMP